MPRVPFLRDELIRAGLSPLSRLRRLVEDRQPNDLHPIRMSEAPAEVHALVVALNSLLAAVRRNVETQKRFISDAAHQLRTPLAGVKSQAELALEAAQDPQLRARLERVRASAIRSAHLVNQLLTLARAEPGAGRGGISADLDLSEATGLLAKRCRQY